MAIYINVDNTVKEIKNESGNDLQMYQIAEYPSAKLVDSSGASTTISKKNPYVRHLDFDSPLSNILFVGGTSNQHWQSRSIKAVKGLLNDNEEDTFDSIGRVELEYDFGGRTAAPDTDTLRNKIKSLVEEGGSINPLTNYVLSYTYSITTTDSTTGQTTTTQYSETHTESIKAGATDLTTGPLLEIKYMLCSMANGGTTHFENDEDYSPNNPAHVLIDATVEASFEEDISTSPYDFSYFTSDVSTSSARASTFASHKATVLFFEIFDSDSLETAPNFSNMTFIDENGYYCRESGVFRDVYTYSGSGLPSSASSFNVTKRSLLTTGEIEETYSTSTTKTQKEAIYMNGIGDVYHYNVSTKAYDPGPPTISSSGDSISDTEYNKYVFYDIATDTVWYCTNNSGNGTFVKGVRDNIGKITGNLRNNAIFSISYTDDVTGEDVTRYYTYNGSTFVSGIAKFALADAASTGVHLTSTGVDFSISSATKPMRLIIIGTR